MLTIVFDLDGTLVDTAPDLIDTLNFTLTEHELPAVPYDEARPMIGGGARGMIERALAADGRDCYPAAVDRLYSRLSPTTRNISPTARARFLRWQQLWIA
jgi:phosphoglycolate phosphatase